MAERTLKTLGKPPERPEGGIGLGAALTIGFSILSIIPLLVLALVTHSHNENRMLVDLDRQLTDAANDAVRTVNSLTYSADRIMGIVAAAAEADPKLFSSDAGYQVLWQSLRSSDHIDAIYVSYEDGRHRVVTRVDADRRRSDPEIPADARWHASYIDPFSAGDKRARHRWFSAKWPKPLPQRYAVPTSLDLRKLSHYAMAKATGQLAIAKPAINPDTNSMVISMGRPIFEHGKFVGFVGANITLHHVSAFLRENQVSPGSVTVILDEERQIIAHPEPRRRPVKGAADAKTIELNQLGANHLADALAALGRSRRSTQRFMGRTGQDSAVTARPVPLTKNTVWQVVTIAPVEDFVGSLEKDEQTLLFFIASLVIVELLLVLLFARKVASRIESVSSRFAAIRHLRFLGGSSDTSTIREIRQLQVGFKMLSSSLGSFAKYVPQGVVWRLLRDNSDARLQVEQRDLSVFFCDLEGFTTQSEVLAPEELLKQVTDYFEAVTAAVTEEQGTVDKFIGDAVMAFWGAPADDPEHVFHACRGAMRAKRRMEAVRRRWESEGRPLMRIRIGLHTASVLVGNIGTPDRLSYTALGDGVNVASRLEGLNKGLGTTILISEEICQIVGDRVVVKPLQTFEVKGRQEPVMTYELLGIIGETDPELAPPSAAS